MHELVEKTPTEHPISGKKYKRNNRLLIQRVRLRKVLNKINVALTEFQMHGESNTLQNRIHALSTLPSVDRAMTDEKRLGPSLK